MCIRDRLDTFAPKAKVIHFEIDPAEVNKNRIVEVSVLGDVAISLVKLLDLSNQRKISIKTSNWLAKIQNWKNNFPLMTPPKEGEIYPQEVLIALRELAHDAYIKPMLVNIRCGQLNIY